jgi:hypothetical protein
MSSTFQPAWLRGDLPGISALLQPVAHALVDADEDVQKHVSPLTSEQVAVRLGGTAAVGYHVLHAIGSLDRLFTYARGEALSDAQLETLSGEKSVDLSGFDGARLATTFAAAIERAHDQLRHTEESDLLATRLVGRAKLPSTTLGLLFHAAEHTARHVGQIVTTSRIVRDQQR